MFNYHNRQYIFRRSSGEIWNFFHDMNQDLCYQTLTRRRTWSSPVVLHKNTYKHFYVDMDRDGTFHILYQDNEGNIYYSRLGGQSIKSVPVLNSKTPMVYNKQLFLAPFKSSVYIFYVLHHDNSFLLGCQVLSGGRISNPKVVDYVSGSSLPCSIVYDANENIYVFYQSHDGNFLQLGFKKLTKGQKNWSDFTPITKYNGNCEYPHALIDENGVIHLCYQRRSSKYYELVYQQKAPDRNLWSPEIVIHSSPYSFENASILNSGGDIIVYWVRENTIYYSAGTQGGVMWARPARLSFPVSRMLQCLCFKSGSATDNSPHLPPGIYPGSLSYGLQLAFYPGDAQEDISKQASSQEDSREDVRKLLMDTFKKMQGNIDEIREVLSLTKIELSKLTTAYNELLTGLNKHEIRFKMLESRLPSSKAEPLIKPEIKPEIKQEIKPDDLDVKPDSLNEKPDELSESHEVTGKKPAPSLPPDKLKEWEAWEGPEEWN